RAKEHLRADRTRLNGTTASRRAVAERFARAFATGNGSELTEILARDVGMWSDGGGKASAARRPLVGREEVLNFLVGLYRTAQTTRLARQVSMRIEDVNSEPALVIRLGRRLESIFVLSVEQGLIAGIRVVRNPDKLTRIDRQLRTAADYADHAD